VEGALRNVYRGFGGEKKKKVKIIGHTQKGTMGSANCHKKKRGGEHNVVEIRNLRGSQRQGPKNRVAKGKNGNGGGMCFSESCAGTWRSFWKAEWPKGKRNSGKARLKGKNTGGEPGKSVFLSPQKGKLNFFRNRHVESRAKDPEHHKRASGLELKTKGKTQLRRKMEPSYPVTGTKKGGEDSLGKSNKKGQYGGDGDGKTPQGAKKKSKRNARTEGEGPHEHP